MAGVYRDGGVSVPKTRRPTSARQWCGPGDGTSKGGERHIPTWASDIGMRCPQLVGGRCFGTSRSEGGAREDASGEHPLGAGETSETAPIGILDVSAKPTHLAHRDKEEPSGWTAELVELTGLEPVTPCLQSRCATNCAIAPCGASGLDLNPGSVDAALSFPL